MDNELGASWTVDPIVCRLLICGCIFLVRFCYKFHCRFLQTTHRHAELQSIFSLQCPVVPLLIRARCTTWSSKWTLCCPASSLLSALESDHRFPTICGSHAALHPLASRSRFYLTTTSVLLSQLYTLAPTTRGASILSFVRSGMDRPFRPICSSPSADFQSLRSLPNKSNRPCVFHTQTPSATRLRNQSCRARSSRTPRRCCPLAIVGQVDPLSTLWDVLTNLRYLRVSSSRLSQTTGPPSRTDGAEAQDTTHSLARVQFIAGKDNRACKPHRRGRSAGYDAQSRMRTVHSR